MRQRLQRFLARCLEALRPKPDHTPEVRLLTREVAILRARESMQQNEAWERIQELIEATRMAGSGPWRVDASVIEETNRLVNVASESLRRSPVALREATPLAAQGATGDIELALQNVEWMRQVNLSWLEFSRWGIQQIILISRLNYIKNPWIQRGINVAASYVWGRGYDITCDDDKAQETFKEFLERNKKVLGQAALSDLQKRLYYDGQVFFVFFADRTNKGLVSVRTIDATEVFEVITDPDDTDTPWLYHRKWTETVFNMRTGSQERSPREAYYPDVNWEADERPDTINGSKVFWDTPVLCLKGGVGVSKWHFDTPKVYAALDWAKNGRKMLEADLTIHLAHSQIALAISTKGGQNAIEGIKQQMGTTIGPTSNLWDMNPPAIAGSTMVSGPGTTLEAVNTRGKGGDPSEVKEYRNMVACVLEIPPTWLGDMETSNLSTAQTLDRPTELGFLEKQERWREALICIARYVLSVSGGAPSGTLREGLQVVGTKVQVIECARRRKPNGTWVYEAAPKKTGVVQVKVTFPAIREGDMPANVKAIAEAMTLDNKGGQVVGIDEKVGVGLLAEELGVEDYQEVLDKQYPDNGPDKYDPSRTKEPLPAPIGKILPDPGGLPQAPGGRDPVPADKPVTAAERLVRALEAFKRKTGRAA